MQRYTSIDRSFARPHTDSRTGTRVTITTHSTEDGSYSTVRDLHGYQIGWAAGSTPLAAAQAAMRDARRGNFQPQD